MLAQLYIENIAVIKKASISFERGFNVFTGETGAGKTILVHAINAVLGERTSREMIRTGEQRALVSALFIELAPQAVSQLAEWGYEPEEDGSLLVSREILSDGRTTAKINGRPATVSMLRQVTGCLVDIHGQHDSQMLLSPERHLQLVDACAQLQPQLAQYRQAYEQMCSLRRQLEECRMDEAEKARRIDLLTYQTTEIEQAQLQEGEEETLHSQRELIRNAEKIAETLQQVQFYLDGDEETPGAVSSLGEVSDLLAAVSAYLPDFGRTAERLTEIRYELEEIRSDLAGCLEEVEYDPRALDHIEKRLDLLYSLKKKYGPELSDVLSYYEKAVCDLEHITGSEQRAAQLTAEYEAAHKQVVELAEQLSAQRQQAADSLVRQVAGELAYLDMASVRLSFRHTIHEPGPEGIDSMELMISTNPGEPPKPMAKIASGGELSRIMLSIKNVLAQNDQIQTSVFDEIDTGVSGKAAQKIGEKLAQVSRDRQVICVTHLAQVAAFAGHHLLIAKRSTEDSTVTSVTPLQGEERVREIARIVSGEHITELSLQNAREMLALAKI